MLTIPQLIPFNHFHHVQKFTISASLGFIDNLRVTFEVPDFICQKMKYETYRIFVAFKGDGE